MPNKNRIQQVGIFMGAERIEVERIQRYYRGRSPDLRDAMVGLDRFFSKRPLLLLKALNTQVSQ